MKIEKNMLVDRKFIFQTAGEEEEGTYQEGERKYLLSGQGGSNFDAGNATYLVCPDDNSDLANHIKTDSSLND